MIDSVIRYLRTRSAVALGAVSLALCGPVSVAAADPAPPAEAPPAKVELVLDLSGSMKQNDAGGQTRLEAAKQAVNRIIDAAPANAQVGIRVYGAAYPGTDKALGCADTQLLVPVAVLGEGAKAAARQKVASLNAVGFTPIGNALRAASDDLGTQGERHVILVSDGEDTCAPPQPCEVAKELNARGTKLTVDAVGFNVSGAARDQLKCISTAGGGAYADAKDVDSLVSNMSSLFRRAWTPYDASGRPIQGATTSCVNAPIVEDGQYLDAFVTSRDLWYRIRKSPDEDLAIGATAIFSERMRTDDDRENSAFLTHLFIRSGPADQPQSWLLKEGVALEANNIVTTGASGGTNSTAQAPDGIGCLRISHNAEVDPQRRILLELLVSHPKRPGAATTAGAPAPERTTPDAAAVPSGTPVTDTGARVAASSDDEDGPGTAVTIGLIAAAVLAGGVSGSFVAGARRRQRRQA
ncbi:VWA domain-containing protein [Embleya sp. NBC_00896]|uniref:VWA domain-containing protein n=1 Tax=Embleya sp. NBC_00896 TaxID=2975961 RepID=UPI0038660CD6|nr:VWA domain-containing protein [Embleya sp. NBC_00896]